MYMNLTRIVETRLTSKIVGNTLNTRADRTKLIPLYTCTYTMSQNWREVYMYMYMYIHVHVYIYIYICIYNIYNIVYNVYTCENVLKLYMFLNER